MPDDNSEVVSRTYRCKICNTNHKVKLNKKIIKGRSKFPFPYVQLHDFINNNQEFKELLTILYIDNNLQIRSAEIQEIMDDSLFSKKQVVSITKALLEENERLREDVIRLTEKLNELKKK